MVGCHCPCHRPCAVSSQTLLLSFALLNCAIFHRRPLDAYDVIRNTKLVPREHRLEEGVDCSQREPPSWLADGDQAGEGGIEDEDMGDLMAEILAEEVRARARAGRGHRGALLIPFLPFFFANCIF